MNNTIILKRYACGFTPKESGALWVEQYVLEYCECDSDGEWVSGSGYAVHDDWKVV